MEEFKLTPHDMKNSNQSIHKFNHIAQNKELSSKIVQYKKNILDFKKTVLDKNNHRNIELLRVSIDSANIGSREEAIDKSKKWAKFRERRAEVVDKFINEKRK